MLFSPECLQAFTCTDWCESVPLSVGQTSDICGTYQPVAIVADKGKRRAHGVSISIDPAIIRLSNSWIGIYWKFCYIKYHVDYLSFPLAILPSNGYFASESTLENYLQNNSGMFDLNWVKSIPEKLVTIVNERDIPYYFLQANQQQACTKIYSLTHNSLTVNEFDWHILAGTDERINSHCFTRMSIYQVIQCHMNRRTYYTNISYIVPVVLHVLPSEFRVDPVLHEHMKLPAVLVQMW